jgi:phosphohistidine swiveling domain-containing protein
MVYSGKFEPPSPGAWERESTHMQRPVSRFFSESLPQGFIRGFKESSAYYGLLLDYLEVAVVEGFMYSAARPVGAPKDAKGPPPKLVFKLLTWFHPEIRRRIARSREVWEKKLWREQVREWDEQVKPALAQVHQRLLAVNLASLSDEGLAAHIRECSEALTHAVYIHHRFDGCAVVPVGDYLVRASEWTGLSRTELLAPLRGTSPMSAGATAELARLSKAIRDSSDARAALASGRAPAEVLRELREAGGEVGEAVRTYLELVGYRVVTGYDVADRTGFEMPEILMGAIRSAVEQPQSQEGLGAEALAKIRDAVPSAHRAEFDGLMSEARFVFRMRDERTLLNDVVMTGITRRALLEAGRRLAQRGRLDDASHAVDLAPGELVAILSGRDAGPPREVVAEYVRYRTTKTYLDAPEFIGSPPSPPPPASWLPPHAARLARAVAVILDAMFNTRGPHQAEPPSKAASPAVKGLAVGGGTYEGTARLVLSPADFSRVQKGDVLVASATSPAYNMLLPLLGALVTDRGGLLSHPAIVAREYGLPGVVGCIDATTKIPDGARVRVDGTTGEVHLVSKASEAA